MLPSATIRSAVEDDIAAITRITNALIGVHNVEWTDQPHTVEARRQWLQARRSRGFPVLVAERAGAVLGFSTYGDFRDSELRPGYNRTVEHSVHVDRAQWGAGVGRALMVALIAHAAAHGKHMMIGAISGDNADSIAFHERLGFMQTARLPEIGFMRGQYLELVLMQRRVDTTT